MASMLSRPQCVNLLAPRRYGTNLKYMIFKLIIKKRKTDTRCEIALSCMPLNLTNGEVNIGSGNGLVPSGNRRSVSLCGVITTGYGVVNPSQH